MREIKKENPNQIRSSEREREREREREKEPLNTNNPHDNKLVLIELISS